jgi:transposase
MQIKTILNHVQKFKSFVYGDARLLSNTDQPTLEVDVHERRNSRALCSVCEQPASRYDRQRQRRFEFIPLWGIKVFLLYAPRRVDCRSCGVKVEHMPWAVGKRQITRNYAWYLAEWSKRMSWQEVAEAFRTSWHHVFCSVEMAVIWGRDRQDLSGIRSIGIDEVQWQKGHKYLTVVYQIDQGRKRLLWVGQHRKTKTLLYFFRWLGKERSAELQNVCSDMWKPYLKVIKKKAVNAINILDRYHVMALMSKAIDKVRAEEAKQLKADGLEPLLTNSRFILLKRPENLTDKQEVKLADLVQYNLRSIRAYLLKEDFQQFWEYVSPYFAGKFLDAWCTRTMRSKIEPMKKMAKTLRKHRPLLMNWFKARGELSSGVVEGFNNKAKLTMRKSYGFRTFRGIEIALYHAMGDLPEPKLTHRFF